MSKLYLYGIFHANLNFSYIAKDLYPQIVRLCYRPLLEFANQAQIPLAFEMSANTLKTVQQIDPELVELLKELWHRGTCQFIGSGYVQSIMPLMPNRANNQNLQHGNQIYKELLGKTPDMAFVNEQVYSGSLPSIYRDNGYTSLVVNWDSSSTKESSPDLVYKPCSVNLTDQEVMPIVWHYTEAYRAVQSYVEQKSSLNEYNKWFDTKIDSNTIRSMAFYSSDWDVFDFKPWDSYPDGFPSPYQGEMKRLTDLISYLNSREDVEFVTPNKLLDIYSEKPVVTPESASNPLPYKKQDQHGMLRWAVGGRESARYNTQCYLLYQKLISAEAFVTDLSEINVTDDIDHIWRELCFLWNSDFRTFTTEEKNLEFRNRMGAAFHQVETILHKYNRPLNSKHQALDELSTHNLQNMPLQICAPTCILPDHMDDDIALIIKDDIAPCQIINEPSPAGYITLMTTSNYHTADWQDVKIIHQNPNTPKKQNFKVNSQTNTILTPSVEIKFEPSVGGGISNIVFPKIFDEALLIKPQNHVDEGNPHCVGALGDINIQEWNGATLNDHYQTDIIYPNKNSRFSLFVPVLCRLSTDFAVIWKTYRVYINTPRIDINIRLQLKDLVPKSFRLGNMHFNAAAFDHANLKYSTTNGGCNTEQFRLHKQYFNHAEPMYDGVTARTSVGATEGWIVISDSEKGVGLVTDQTSMYSVPMVSYNKSTDETKAFDLSVIHALDEHDPTSQTLWRGHTLWYLSVIGGKHDIIPTTRSAAYFMNKTIESIGDSYLV